MKARLSILFLLFFIQFAHAQEPYKVSGKVIEKGTQLPLPGVSVLIKGSKIGTTTDQSGNFSIQLPKEQETLIFSFLGFSSQELVAKAGANLKVALADASNDLDEVVVVAYGTTKKRDITGSVSRINGEQLQNRQVSNITKALQGLAPGVQAVSSSGQPGTAATIRIRGIGSINASSSPLYVVDGNPYSGDLNSINPSDVESVSVLKDAASSALYGSRGANGVIIITTRSGKRNNETQINASISQGISDRSVKDYKQVTTDQYFENYWLAVKNKQLSSNPVFSDKQAGEAANRQIIGDLGINPYGINFPNPVGLDGKIVPGAKALWDDNWGDATEQTARRTQADLSFSGGGEKSQYYISGGYLNDQGIALGSGFKRYNTRINLTTQAKKWLTAGLNLSASSSTQDYPTSEDSKTSNVIQYSRAIPSFYPIYEHNPDGSFKLDDNNQKIYDFGAYRPSSAIPRSNLPATVGLDKSEIMKDNVSARTFLEATILPELKLKTTYSGDFQNYNSHYYTNPLLGDGKENGGSVSKSNSRTYSWTWNNIATYDKTIGDHHFNVLGGQELYKYNYRVISGSRQRFVLPDLYEPDAAAQLTGFSGSSIDYTLLSFLGRAEYDYKKRYLFSASLRTDGTSRFSPAQRWGTFWSLGASWKVSEEAFLKDTPWLSTLSLRTSYGAQGNDNIGIYYAYKGLYSIKSNLGENGLVTSRLATPDLKWESNLNLNVGLDFGIFHDRINGTIEYFDRRSKDLLFSRPIAPSLGFGSIDENIGALKNQGIEVQINAVPVRTTDFRWTISLNATHYKNTITELPGNKDIPTTTKIMRVGGTISDFYLKEWAGVNPANGDPLWYKTTDDKGTRITTNDYSAATQYYQGTSLPDLTGGISNTFNYKEFEISALFNYSIGGKILDNDYVGLMHTGNAIGRPWSTEILNHWTPENPNTNVPKLTTDDKGWTQPSTRFLYSGTYARLKNLTLGYSLPKALANRWGLVNLKFTITGENLLTFYGHKGMDPEQTIEGTTYYRYPAMRTLSAGLNLTF
ncbi:SusC/RagA family TonB-linked outer membrane protein [Pedobacter gandavensis]|uniref:SusC/RagA family TonB-linked outer membrane protein n=1 Tax=Pedobacter gandavensis TaxID=2679963 RepID=A0ABR6ER19_9SPHI|nr:TonB-dependent receptor [Pedobacter gandavensis]MBB2147694.1 SusC/RagA family TonB-linked outer membrane protein [Pedobacter gandavensis]